jgi:hypothetical protein
MRLRSRVATLAISALAAGGLALMPTVITAAPAAAAASGSPTVYSQNISHAFEYSTLYSTNTATASQTVYTAP